MKINNLNKYISQADQTVYAIDLLKLNLKQKLKSLSDVLGTINLTNSNVFIKQVGEFDVSFLKTMTNNGPALNVSIVVDNIPCTIFQYLEYESSTKKMLNSEGAFTFYSTYYRLLEMQKLSYLFERDFFDDELYIVERSSISRLDYKIDFCYKDPTKILPVNDIIDYKSNSQTRNYFLDEGEYKKHWDLIWNKLNEGKRITYQTRGYFGKGDFQTGWNVGNKNNKSIYVRCYEKLVDTIAKGKVKLYDDYFLFSNVFRLEFEFRIKFNKDNDGKNYTYSSISELEHKIHRFLGTAERVEGEKLLYQYKPNTETDFINVGRYQKDFGGRGYGLFIRGFNPFVVLFSTLIRKEDVTRQKIDELINELIEFFYKYFKKNRKPKIK